MLFWRIVWLIYDLAVRAIGLGRLLNPELVHSGKRIRIVGLKGPPVAQIGAGPIVGKAYAILMQDAAIQFETDELKAEIGEE